MIYSVMKIKMMQDKKNKGPAAILSKRLRQGPDIKRFPSQ